MKRSFKKTGKIGIFAKGFTHDFDQKFKISLMCVFLCLYILFDKVLEKKEAFLKLKNVLLQKSKNLQFRKGVTFGSNFEIYCMCNFP